MSLKAHALAYAAKGWPIFPLKPGEKTPLEGSNGFKDATTNPDTIEAWWTETPDANIGFCPGDVGMAVIDIDPGADEASLDLPETGMEASTPRGGKHLFYELELGEQVPPSASKVAPNVDVRSSGSYVVLSPSVRADGEYRWSKSDKPSYRPDVLLETKTREKHKDAQVWLIEPDLEENIASAIKWLEGEAEVAKEGEGGDATTFATAAYLRSLGISQDLALPLLLEHWIDRCDTSWSKEEMVGWLEGKIENAYSYATSPPGNLTKAYKKAANRQLFQAVKRFKKRVNDGEDKENDSYSFDRFTLHTRAGINNIPEPEWIVEGLLYEDAYAIMYGAEGSYKTFLALDIALSVALGGKVDKAAHFTDKHIPKAGPVLYMTGEGLGGIKRRVAAWEQMHNGGKEVADFWLLDPTPRLFQDDPEALTDFLANAAPFRLIVIDTISRVMQGVNDGEQQNATAFTGMVDELRRVAPGCTILALHHVLKDGTTMRGSRAFDADADITLAIADRIQHGVTMRVGKMKDGEPTAPIRWGLEKMEIGDKSTLVTVPTMQDTRKADRPEKEAGKQKFEQAARERNRRADWHHAHEQIEASACEVLDGIRGKSWTTNRLAEAVAHSLEGISKSNARDHINHAKTEHGSPLHGRYDPIADRFK